MTPAQYAWGKCYPDRKPWDQHPQDVKDEWEAFCAAAIEAHLREVAEELPSATSIRNAWLNRANAEDDIIALFAPLIAKLQAERDELKKPGWYQAGLTIAGQLVAAGVRTNGIVDGVEALIKERNALLQQLADEKADGKQFAQWWDALLREIGISAADLDSMASDNDELQRQGMEKLGAIHMERVELRKQLADYQARERQLREALEASPHDEDCDCLGSASPCSCHKRSLTLPPPPVVAKQDADALSSVISQSVALAEDLPSTEAAEILVASLKAGLSTYRTKYP